MNEKEHAAQRAPAADRIAEPTTEEMDIAYKVMGHQRAIAELLAAYRVELDRRAAAVRAQVIADAELSMLREGASLGLVDAVLFRLRWPAP